MIKRALRLISGSKRRAHTAPLFENLEILTLRKLYVYSIQIFMFKFHHKLLPRIYLDYFVTNYDVHDYNTRQRGCLHATHNRSHSIRYVGVKISNHFMSLLEMNMYYLLYKKNLRYLVLTSDVSHLLDYSCLYILQGYDTSCLLVLTERLSSARLVRAVINQPSYNVIITSQIHFLHHIIFDFMAWILAIYSILEVLMTLFNQWVNWNVCRCQAFCICVLFSFRVM